MFAPSSTQTYARVQDQQRKDIRVVRLDSRFGPVSSSASTGKEIRIGVSCLTGQATNSAVVTGELSLAELEVEDQLI